MLTRVKRRRSPIDADRVFYEEAGRALDQMRVAETSMEQFGSLPSGTLRILAPITFGARTVAPWLPRSRRDTRQCTSTPGPRKRKVDLVGEGVDLAIHTGELAESPRRVSSTACRATIFRWATCLHDTP